MSKYKREGGVGKKNRGKEGLRERDVKEERGGRGGLLKKKEKGGEGRCVEEEREGRGGEGREGRRGHQIFILCPLLLYCGYLSDINIYLQLPGGGRQLTYTSKEGGGQLICY